MNLTIQGPYNTGIPQILPLHPHGDLTIQGPLEMFKLVHFKAQTSVGKWAVGIRLKCLLVLKCRQEYF